MICGIDEAGRGPLAGPLCAAAVVLPDDFPFSILADSKKLSPKKRLEVEKTIIALATGWAIGWASHREIDEINVLQATLHAMQRAYTSIKKRVAIDEVLIDGNMAPKLDVFCRCIVKGDDSIPQIMAASILAKCARDRLMIRLDSRYPQYGYAQHKGYPTASHIQACRLYGPSPIQRRSFGPIF
ncbi:MAG: ribonuclease HII [Sphaerochaetaceae bacterium]